jgi:hypothetical protein
VAKLIPVPYHMVSQVTFDRLGGFQGLNVSVPMPHLRANPFGIRRLVTDDQFERATLIDGWLGKGKFGPDWYSKLLDLLLFRDHGLFKRHTQKRFHGQLKLLEEVFAEYWGLIPESDARTAARTKVTGHDVAKKLSSRLRSASRECQQLSRERADALRKPASQESP